MGRMSAVHMKEAIKQWIRYHAIKEWYKKNERVLLPGTLVFGVIVDSLTFTSINITTAFFLLGIYFVIAGGMIFFQHAYDAGRIPKEGKTLRYIRISVPLVIQFLFGALLSASFVFYFFSGNLFVSWPFFAPLIILMVSNDIFRQYYLRPTVQISVYFFILFSLTSIIIPFAFRNIGVSIFLLSGMVSVLLIFGYIALLGPFIPDIKRERRRLTISIAVIFFFMNGLYFLNIIPPIPLALRDTSVAHDVVRSGSSYQLLVEDESWWQRMVPGERIHQDASGKIFVYSAIFAPRDLVTTIIHHWQWYDKIQREWVTSDNLAFEITGGTKTGYRGYSFKSRVEPGRWRVDVETERGQAMGRVRFRVVESGEPPALKTVVK